MRRLKLLALALFATSLMATMAHANNPALDNSSTLFNILEDKAGFDTSLQLKPEEVLANIIFVALGFVGIVLIVLVIYGGYLWGTARGNEERVTQAQELIRNAIIGLIIIFAAGFITAFVVTQIGKAVLTSPDLYTP